MMAYNMHARRDDLPKIDRLQKKQVLHVVSYFSYGPAPPWQASRLTDLMSVTSQVDADREETVFDGLVVIM